jgi:nucleoside-diphosphate-sugar epimerase
MYKILVTGATGFVGRHVLPQLIKSGAEIHAVAREMPEQALSISWHAFDLLDQTQRVRLICDVRPDTLVHLAWDTTPGHFWSSLSNLDWAAATLDLVRHSAERGVSRIVGVGTCAEYDPADQECDEYQTPIAPTSLYGSTKDACRRAVQACAEASGISWAWARLFYPIGIDEKETRLIPSLAAALISGCSAQLSSGAAVRDFIDVRDAGEAIAELALSQVIGPVNIGTGRPTSVRQIAELLGRIVGRPDLIEIGALPDRAGEPHYLVARINRLVDEVGFRPHRQIEETLTDIVTSHRIARPRAS